MKQLLILGGGTAGSLMANKMVRALPDGWRVTVVDRDDEHIYQPGLLFVPFGDKRVSDLVRPRMNLVSAQVNRVIGTLAKLDPEAKSAVLEDGTTLSWDVLVIATGAELHPEWTPGMTLSLIHI